MRFHNLRHSFATRLAQRGADLYSVKELIGHKKIAMTMRYAHHDTESLRREVEILDGGGTKLGTVCKMNKGLQSVTP